jgi:hypothetical protein
MSGQSGIRQSIASKLGRTAPLRARFTTSRGGAATVRPFLAGGLRLVLYRQIIPLGPSHTGFPSSGSGLAGIYRPTLRLRKSMT